VNVVAPGGTVCRTANGTCDVAETCSGTAGQACPADGFTPAETPCDDDADQCTIDECDGNGTCAFVTGVAVCGDGDVDATCGEQCDDSNTNPGDGCSATCQIEGELACAPAPRSDCRRPIVSGKSSLQLRNGTTQAKDAVKWKWLAGARTTVPEYGDPTTATDFQLCVYDASGLIVDATAPAGGNCAGKPCWKATGTSGFKYKNKTLVPDGLQQLVLRAGADGKAKIMLAGRGALLALPSVAGVAQPVTVQIQNGTGRCWEAVYSAPAQLASPTQLKDRAD
jgi:cysteine-rich repeat protein